jgi:glycosyltransferase involved in cell wall biosynthesis
VPGSDGAGVVLVAHLSYYRHAAKALAGAGLLDRYVAAPLHTRPVPGGRLPVVGSRVRYFNRTRVDPGLAGVAMHRMWGAQLVALGIQWATMSTGRGTGLPARARIWDAAATAHVGNPRVIHVVSELAGWCTSTARRRGALSVCDVRSAHPRAQLASVVPFLARRGLEYRLPEAGILARLERAFAEADLIVCNSDYTRTTFLEQGLPEERVAAVPLGCDLAAFEPAPAPPERFTVLFVGRERYAKGALDLAEAARSLSPHSRLWFSGDPDPVTIQALARTNAEVRFLGPLPTDRTSEIYRQASVLALPSYSDGFGMVVLEAMASGLPVVVSDRVGAAGPVAEGDAGFVVGAGDVDALGERLRALEADPGLVARRGRAARAVAEQHPWSSYGDRLVTCYRERVLPLLG